MTARSEFDLALKNTLDASEAAILAEIDKLREASSNKVTEEFIKIRQELGILETSPGNSEIVWDHVWNLKTDTKDSVSNVDLDPIGIPIITDNCIRLDGVSSVYTTNVETLKSPKFTISLWTKLTINDLARFIWVFERGNGNEVLDLIVHADLTIEAQLLQVGGYVLYRTQTPVVVLGQRQHHVITADGTNLKYYLDGVEIFSIAYDGTIDHSATTRFVVGSELVDLVIPRNGIIGEVDTLRFKREAITAEQVNKIYLDEGGRI